MRLFILPFLLIGCQSGDANAFAGQAAEQQRVDAAYGRWQECIEPLVKDVRSQNAVSDGDLDRLGKSCATELATAAQGVSRLKLARGDYLRELHEKFSPDEAFAYEKDTLAKVHYYCEFRNCFGSN